MRKRDKKQILELIHTLEEANSLLLSMPHGASDEELVQILSDEQSAAISIGNRIEELEGKGTKAVEILEQYCELLWQITQETEQETRRRGIEQLFALTTQEKTAVSDIRETIDVVFLPYKASMWDCMETVWKAAQDDPDCNVYVIPIPYFDLKSDGSAGEMHCEADLMPDYVPVTSYKDYALSKMHPEVIYIHNPYDEYNRVTSVHPDFYSSVIKDYTDMLVYIPYFITAGRLPETHRYLPAYIYADRVILQTEAMIEDIDDSIPREKLLPLGSPKKERLIWMETHKDQLDFPEEWNRRANGRKVILYNISISGLLKEREKILDKMEEVFSLAASHGDIVLLLRPHPLLDVTLASMCADLTARYRRLMRYFKKHNIGIVDKTPDPDRAVAFADAYIGEISSSIVDMFRVVNKPRFFLTDRKFYQPTLDEMQSERTSDVCRIGDEIWFVTDSIQLLCKLDLKNEKIEVEAEVPEVEQAGYYRYVNIVNYENKMILVPYRADALCVYDITRKSFTKHYFKEEFVNNCFGRAILYKHYLFLTPMDYPAIVRYDILTGEFEYFDQCISDALELIGVEKQSSPFVWAVSNYGDELYIGSVWSNVVLKFNMGTCQYTVSRVGKETNTYRGMIADKEYCWLILCDSPNVVRWNRITGETDEFDEFPDGFEAGSIPFKNVMDFDDELYMVPFHANHICKLDKRTGKISFAEFVLPYKEGTYLSEFYARAALNYEFAKKISENEIAALSLYDDSLIILNVNDKSCKKIPVRIDNYLMWESRKSLQNLKEIRESENQTISKYLERVSADLFDTNKRRGSWKFIMDKDLQTGSKIHAEIKSLVKIDRK